MAAGRGSQMTELTHNTPKCLLPIANKPMIWYPLKMLENAGFEEAIVIIQEEYESLISAALSRLKLNIKLDFFRIKEDLGTADSLRLIHDKIKTDVLVASCDLVTDIPLHNLFELHRMHQSCITAMFSQISPQEVSASRAPGPKSKTSQTKDFVGLDRLTPRLIFLVSEADLVSDTDDDELKIKKSVMRLFPQTLVRSDLLDAHLYVIHKRVCDYIAGYKSLSMLKSEVMPHIVRKQFSKPLNATVEDMPHESVSSPKNHRDIYSFMDKSEEITNIQKASVWNDHYGDLRGPYQDQAIRCFAYVDKEGFCLRANTLLSYWEVNRQLMTKPLTILSSVDEEVPSSSSKAQIGDNCLIGKSTNLSDKCSIQQSFIGRNCTIENRVRISNCIVGDGVTIKEGTTLQGCIVLNNITIETQCDIKDCVVAVMVDANSSVSNEYLVEKLMKM